MSKEQEHIEKIRREKFWLDENGQLRDKNPLIDDLTNSIERLSEGLYSKDTHFIFELIQNAEDNIYNDVQPALSFQLVKDDPTGTPNATGALIVQNNEVGFLSANVDAICAIGKTTKSKIQGYIGEKGIGFKSVFRITTRPHIFSNGYQFCFPEKNEKTGLGYIVPHWIASVPSEIDPNQTTIILPLDKHNFGYDKIKEMLQDVEPETILFLSKLKEIRIRTDSGDDLTILKDDTEAPRIQILIEGTKQGESYSEVKQFLLFTQTVERPQDVTHEKREGIDKRDISIAFPADDNKDSMGKIFAYLPVRSDTGFPFLINADFILPSSREDIQDVPWNRWLMKCVAKLLADKFELLKEENLLTVELLEALAKRLNELDEDSLFCPIVDAVHDALMNKELLPADDETFVSARNAKLARGAELRKLLTHDQLREFFQSDDDIKWLSGEITQDRTPNLRYYLVSELSVEEITPDGFARRISSTFLASQTDDWFIAFYKYLSGQEALWKQGSKLYWDKDGPLRSKPFIRLEDKLHVKPFKQDGSPNAYLPPDNDTKFPVISRKIAKDEKAFEFLKKLGLTKPDAVAEVIEHVLPKYEQSNRDISDDEHHRDMRIIHSAYSIDSQEKKNQLTRKLQEASFVRAENLVLKQIEYKEPGQLYFRNKELIMYFDGNKEAWFVSSEYDEKFSDLYSNLGVDDKVYVKRERPGWNRHVVIANSHGWHKRGLNGFDPDIEVDGLEYALKNPTIEKSRYIWSQIAIPNADCIRGIVESSSRKTYENSDKEEKISERFGRLLIETAWIPDKKGNFRKPSELKLDDLPESFERDEKLAKQLGMKKDVVAKLAEEAGIAPEDIDFIKRLKEDPNEYEKVKAILENKEKPAFPTKNPIDPDRRKEKRQKEMSEAPQKEYKQSTRTVRITQATEYTRTWLKEQYTNNKGQMICQICKEEMPFRKRDGEYYFEAVEALSRDHFPREHEAQFLALCPLCAAMYKEFVKNDDEAMESLKDALHHSENAEVPLELGELNTSIRFVEVTFWS